MENGDTYQIRQVDFLDFGGIESIQTLMEKNLNFIYNLNRKNWYLRSTHIKKMNVEKCETFIADIYTKKQMN